MDVGNTNVFHGELITLKEDQGYTTYVFRNLDECDVLHKYLMCVRFPRWETDILHIGDRGYVKYREVIGGIDKWYDGNTFIPYKYTDIHFINFVFEKKEQQNIVL
jgi:hypothetical protein